MNGDGQMGGKNGQDELGAPEVVHEGAVLVTAATTVLPVHSASNVSTH